MPAHSPPFSPIAWWHDDALIRRVVSDVITARMTSLRVSGFDAPATPFDATVRLTRDLGIDSLELTSVASALNELLHLHESGVEDTLLMRRTVGEWVATAVAGLDTCSGAMTFRSSGSTGAQKRCEHTLADLWQEIAEMARLLGDRRRILSVVRSHHIYGFLFTVLLPRVWQLPGTQVLDARAMLPSSLLSRLHDGDVVIGYPDWWRGIAESARKFPPGVIGVTSTAPCSADVANRLHQSGLESLVQVYGSSETAGVGVRASTTNPFELLSYWRRSGTNADEIIRTAPEGHQTTRRVPDVIEWADERHFLPLERRDGAVQVGGINVSPAEVRAVLIAHPDVGDATVRLMTGERLGRLKAFVVPSRSDVDRRALHAALEQWVTVRLAAPQRPRAFTFGDAIPRDALGKASDWRADAIEVPDER